MRFLAKRAVIIAVAVCSQVSVGTGNALGSSWYRQLLTVLALLGMAIGAHHANAQPAETHRQRFDQLSRAADEAERQYGESSEASLAAYLDLADHATGFQPGAADDLYALIFHSAESTFGLRHALSLRAAAGLARGLLRSDRPDQAEPLIKRIAPATREVHGAESKEYVRARDLLGQLYLHQERFEEAEEHLRFVASAARERRGPDSEDALTADYNVAVVLRRMNRDADAGIILDSVGERAVRSIGPTHPLTNLVRRALAYEQYSVGQFEAAAASYTEARQVALNRRGPLHAETIDSMGGLFLSRLLMEDVGAYHAGRDLIDALRRRRALDHDVRQLAALDSLKERPSFSVVFADFADAAFVAAAQDTANAKSIHEEAFTALQDAVFSPAAEAVARAAARRRAARISPALAALVRERQDLDRELTDVDGEYVSALALGGEASGQAPERRGRREAILGRLVTINELIKDAIPAYDAFVNPAPASIEEVQSKLRTEEALLLIVPSQFRVHVMVVTRERLTWAKPQSAFEMNAQVQRLRYDLGATVLVPQNIVAYWDAEQRRHAHPTFRRDSAYEVYQKLIAPVRGALAGKRRLFVVAGGFLAGLPLSVLVTRPPEGDDHDPRALRKTAWFADDFALTYLPSVQALGQLRDDPRGSAVGSTEGFLGFGDPLLSGAATERGLTRGRPGFRVPARGTVRGGSQADVETLRDMSRLPGTAVELEALRQTLGAGSESLFLAGRAREPLVRQAPLESARIVAFATHGLMPNEAIGAGEPGLVLTPPLEPSEEDDGFLAASEVAELRLNAEWVILSACNTASSDDGSGSGFSSLIRAFLSAGARSVLASHWPVSDEVAPHLVLRTLQLQMGGADARLPRAEAFQQAMREVRSGGPNGSWPEKWSHPFYWAPFVLLGEGSD